MNSQTSWINFLFFIFVIIFYCEHGQSAQQTGENEEILRAKKILRGIDPDVDLTTPQLIEKDGYPCEIHHAITRDGFILELHRIPHGRHGNYHHRKPVLYQHAAFQSSSDAIINGRHNSIAYELADNGYDVWLANHRANTYSYKHVNLTMDDRKYWDFSLHDMGVYDLPAEIDYILDFTKEKDLYHIGHAWGAIQFYMLTSEYPEYNDKIRLSISLAPALFLGYWRSPMRFIAPLDIFGLLLTSATYQGIGDDRVRPDRLLSFLRSVAPELCKGDLIDNLVCNNVMFLFEGYNYAQRNNSNLPRILSRVPTTISTKSLVHMTQMIKSNRFAKFNYGRKRNIELYGHPNPPNYDLTNIYTKVAIIWGANDYMAAPKNIEVIARRTPNVVANIRVDDDKFNHYDFSYAIDAKTLVYDHCLRLLEMY